MVIWILVSAIGAGASAAGFWSMFGRYRRGEITGRTLSACVVGFLSFACYALVSALRPDIATGPMTVAMLTPAFAAIVVLVRDQRQVNRARSGAGD